MLGRCYEIISEMASRSSNRKYAQRPHSGLPNKEDMIVRNSNRSPRGLHATLTAPIGVLTQFLVRLRKLFVNGKQMRMASVLKAGKYRKISNV